jgi:hypothetical protein
MLYDLLFPHHRFYLVFYVLVLHDRPMYADIKDESQYNDMIFLLSNIVLSPFCHRE